MRVIFLCKLLLNGELLHCVCVMGYLNFVDIVGV